MGILKRQDEKHLAYEHAEDNDCEIYCKGNCIAQGEGKVLLFEDPFMEEHPVYEVHCNGHIEYVREQLMLHTGVVNFRDIGGYFTQDGRQVRHGLFYRSAPLIGLHEQQKRYLDSLRLHTIYDLRSAMEIRGNEDYLPEGCCYVHASGIAEMDEASMHGNFDFSQLMQQADLQMLKGFIRKIYDTLPIQNPAYQKMMKDICEKHVPIVFHCSAGKDRTGFAAALILLILGVDKDTVIQDYLLSNELRKKVNEEIFAHVKKEQEGMEALMCVYPEYIQRSFDRIEEVYGTFESYILQEFGIDQRKRAELQKIYLY